MSTRANIIVTDRHNNELIFYRHSDGYPEGAMPTLETFLRYVTEDRIRDNTSQAAGWLVVLGREEYADAYKDDKSGLMPRYAEEPRLPERQRARGHSGYGGDDWKVGAIEPTSGLHGDIEYLYIIDLAEKVIRVDGEGGYEYSGKFREKVDSVHSA